MTTNLTRKKHNLICYFMKLNFRFMYKNVLFVENKYAGIANRLGIIFAFSSRIIVE